MTKKGIGWRQHTIFVSWIFVLLYFIIGYSLPYSFYTNVTVLEAYDVCVGSDTIRYHSVRYPKWDMLGTSYSEIVRFDDQIVYETTIKRGTVEKPTSWGYESEIDEVYYDTDWSEPFVETGRYGINSWNTIYPLPFIEKTQFTSAVNQQFNVIVCDS